MDDEDGIIPQPCAEASFNYKWRKWKVTSERVS